MKSLVESILDDDVLDKATVVASKKFSDEFHLFNMYVETSDYSDVVYTDYIDWKKLQKEIQHNIKYDTWEYAKKYTDPGAKEMATAFINQPLLSFSQNFLVYIRNFAKGEVDYEYVKSLGKDRYIYTFKGKKKNELIITFVCKPK